MQKAVYSLIIIIALVFLLALITGYFIGPNYNTETEFSVDYTPGNVWDVLTNLDSFEEGKRDVSSIEILGRYLNLYAWEENLNNGGFRRYRQIEKKEDQKLVIEMTNSSYGVTGTWEFNLKKDGSRTLVNIKEKSTNISIVGRGFRYFLGSDKESKDWVKFIRVRLYKQLLTTL